MTAISLKKKKMQYVYANKFDKKKTIFFFLINIDIIAQNRINYNLFPSYFKLLYPYTLHT